VKARRSYYFADGDLSAPPTIERRQRSLSFSEVKFTKPDRTMSEEAQTPTETPNESPAEVVETKEGGENVPEEESTATFEAVVSDFARTVLVIAHAFARRCRSCVETLPQPSISLTFHSF
jgi:hypothetical protein